jgi:hypothetical protein
MLANSSFNFTFIALKHNKDLNSHKLSYQNIELQGVMWPAESRAIFADLQSWRQNALGTRLN